ncbi:ankyrin repeat domain-containing protein [Flavobacterium sp. UBA4197]|uniref:ankyrin repeat domain-containing protein n=1 Tax=Flavobacterium sp. UBA4197 TaxID=1946546 RepID=UPI00257B51ED|nr:ankyrin repeat domain-containing protein [Flavobacterium sp. UBA4197]
MKKSIIILGLALVAFTNVSVASNTVNTKVQTVSILNATPLCTAISKGDVATIKKFIEYGADVNERTNNLTPLMFAVRYNNLEVVKLLVEKGADLTAVDQNGSTVLKLAEMYKNNDIIEVLKAAGARK